VWAAAALVLLDPLAARASDEAGEPAAEADPPAVDAQSQARTAPAPWRGSRFTWRHAVGQTAFDRSFLTYDPYYAMIFAFEPRWWLTDGIWIRAGLDVTRELTQANDTTYSGEAWVSDLSLAVGWSRFWTIPLVGIDLSADVLLVAPTSKASQARTLALAIRPSLRLARSFDLLGGLAIGTTLRGGPALHRYTTGQREAPLVPGCELSPSGCGEYLNTGQRNAKARFQQSFDVWLGVTDWLSVSAAYGYYIDWLYTLEATEGSDFTPQTATSERYYSMLNFELTARPLPALEVGFGFLAFAPQQRPDAPYSTLYVDLRLDVDGLISQLSGTQAERSLFNEL
jgi:hypothetical protein